MVLKRFRARARRILRKIFRQRDSAARIARGMSAGFLAAAFPLPGLQIPLSLLLAWAFRGNKVVSIFPQFISNAGTMLPLAVAQFEIGRWFWPARTGEAAVALRAAADAWSWSAPWVSLKALFAALGSLGLNSLGPLAIGVLLSGAVMAAVSYPLTVIAVRTWRAGRRRRRLARGLEGRRPRPLVLPKAEEPALTTAEALARYVRYPALFQRAQGAKLLVDGREAYPEMLGAIESARRSVELETYILRADRTGGRFQESLQRAAARGVRVRLLYDWVGCLGLPDAYVRDLIAAGVEVNVYHPLVLLRPSWAVNRRDHRKILVVDGSVAFTGGLNIADEYASREEGGEGWRDTHVRLDGPEVAGRLGHLFEYAWKRAMPYLQATGRGRLGARMKRRLARVFARAPAAESPVPSAASACDGVAVKILGNEEFRFRRLIQRAYLHAVRNARRYVLIENAYFIPTRPFRRALARAARRGVLVAVAVARHSDVAVAAYASRNLYTELLTSGVRLFEWPQGMMHAKTAVIDDAWAIVGSYNFDHRSLFHQLEAAAVVADAEFARRLRDQMLADMARCQEVSLEEHEARPWGRMLLESGAYLLRHWL